MILPSSYENVHTGCNTIPKPDGRTPIINSCTDVLLTRFFLLCSLQPAELLEHYGNTGAISKTHQVRLDILFQTSEAGFCDEDGTKICEASIVSSAPFYMLR